MNKGICLQAGLFLLISLALVAIRYPGALAPWHYVYNDEFRVWKPVALAELGSEYYGRLRPLHFLLTDMMFAAGYQGLIPGKMGSWLAALLIPLLLLMHGLQIRCSSLGIIAPLLLSTVPLFVYLSIVGIPDVLVGLCLLSYAIAWELAEKSTGRKVCYALAGSFIGLALLVKEQSLFYLIPLFWGLVRSLLKKLQTQSPALNLSLDARYGWAFLGAGIVFLPLLLRSKLHYLMLLRGDANS